MNGAGLRAPLGVAHASLAAEKPRQGPLGRLRCVGQGRQGQRRFQAATQLTRRVLPRFGVRKALLAGLGITGLGQVWLFTISNAGSYPVKVLGGIIITAFGMGLVFPTASVAVTSGVGPGERGLAGGLFVTTQQVGLAIGLAALATIAAAQTSAHDGSLVAGYKAAFLVSIGISVVAVLVVANQMKTRAAPRATEPTPSRPGNGCSFCELDHGVEDAGVGPPLR